MSFTDEVEKSEYILKNIFNMERISYSEALRAYRDATAERDVARTTTYGSIVMAIGITEGRSPKEIGEDCSLSERFAELLDSTVKTIMAFEKKSGGNVDKDFVLALSFEALIGKQIKEIARVVEKYRIKSVEEMIDFVRVTFIRSDEFKHMIASSANSAIKVLVATPIIMLAINSIKSNAGLIKFVASVENVLNNIALLDTSYFDAGKAINSGEFACHLSHITECVSMLKVKRYASVAFERGAFESLENFSETVARCISSLVYMTNYNAVSAERITDVNGIIKSFVNIVPSTTVVSKPFGDDEVENNSVDSKKKKSPVYKEHPTVGGSFSAN